MVDIEIVNKSGAIYFACSCIWLILGIAGIASSNSGWGSISFEDEEGSDESVGLGTRELSGSGESISYGDLCELTGGTGEWCLINITGLMAIVFLCFFFIFIFPLMFLLFQTLSGKKEATVTGCCACNWKQTSLQICLLLCLAGGCMGAAGLFHLIGVMMLDEPVSPGPLPFLLMLCTANMWIFFLMIQCGCGVWKAEKRENQVNPVVVKGAADVAGTASEPLADQSDGNIIAIMPPVEK